MTLFADDSNETGSEPAAKPLSRWIAGGLSLLTAIVYFFSNPNPRSYYDYTFRVAENFLRGSIGFSEARPPWLNEFVPFEGYWYSVFPLGSVLTMIPVAALRASKLISEHPGEWIAALQAAAVCWYLFKIASHYDATRMRKVLMAMGILFGTFMWTNLTLAGAWQLALGFAMVGQLGAIYYTVYKRRPLLAGIFFALAFGNRTENLLTAPIFMYLLARSESEPAASKPLADAGGSDKIRSLAMFCSVPFVLGVATLVYNYLRFHSFVDFGYARIPGVLEEPWYHDGIFSTHYIPDQAYEMLIKAWEWRDTFPYIVPDGFSSSVLVSSPFLIFLTRLGSRDRVLKYASWAAVAVLTFLLWIHGNSGGWQFGYRYAMILLPWAFVILLENSPRRISPVEWTLYTVSFVVNIYATWLFHWTEFVETF